MNTFDHIPGPAPTTLLGWRGNLLQFGRDPLTTLTRLRAQYGDVFAFVRSDQPARRNPSIFFANPTPRGTLFAFGSEHIRQLMTKPDVFHSGPLLGDLFPRPPVPERRRVLTYIGSGLFGVEGAEHRRQRALVMPAFHKQRITAYRDGMVAQANAMLDCWRVGETRDIWREMMHLTLQIAGKALLGVDVETDAKEFGQKLRQWLGAFAAPNVILLPYDLPGAPFRRWLDLTWEMDGMLRQIVRQHDPHGNDVLALLMQARNEDGTVAFTEDEIVGHAAVFLAAGHETSSNALSWTLFLLSRHPRVMQNLFDELDGTLRGDAPAVEQLPELVLLDAVIKESLRLLPPAPMSGRIVAEQVEFGNYLLEPGTEIGFSSYHTHRDPALYENPQTFDPSRWERIKPNAYEYIPFSAGIRACIGMPFALMEVSILLAQILQRHRLEMPPNANVAPFVGLTMSPRGGLNMIVRPPDKNFTASVGSVRGKIREMIDLSG